MSVRRVPITAHLHRLACQPSSRPCTTAPRASKVEDPGRRGPGAAAAVLGSRLLQAHTLDLMVDWQPPPCRHSSVIFSLFCSLGMCFSTSVGHTGHTLVARRARAVSPTCLLQAASSMARAQTQAGRRDRRRPQPSGVVAPQPQRSGPWSGRRKGTGLVR